MLNKMLSVILVVMLSAVAFLPTTTEASPILVQDFWGKKSDGTTELFATLKIDVLDATQVTGDIYETYGWKSFKVYGQEILPVNTFLFYSQFDMANLYSGFIFFNFDVLESLSNVSFQGFFDADLGFDFYTLLDGDYSDIYTDGVFASSTSVVATPTSLALICIGFFGLALRNRRKL